MMDSNLNLTLIDLGYCKKFTDGKNGLIECESLENIYFQLQSI